RGRTVERDQRLVELAQIGERGAKVVPGGDISFVQAQGAVKRRERLIVAVEVIKGCAFIGRSKEGVGIERQRGLGGGERFVIAAKRVERRSLIRVDRRRGR